ncbi:MAG: response regulator, partial [Spirochaetales bacterium]|nr:response regulator [Spirochaetales bacterium]
MYRVVVADDEEPVLDSFSFIFERDIEDFEISALARSGIEAVNKIKETSPDLVFMDIQMPGMDGLEVIKQIREQFPETVFILATAYERFDIAKRAVPLGIYSYMVKPISRKTIVEKINEVRNYLISEQEKKRKQLEALNLLRISQNERKQKYISSFTSRNPTDSEWKDFSNLYEINTETAAACLVGMKSDIPESIRNEVFKAVSEKLNFKIRCTGGILGKRLLLILIEEKELIIIERFLNNIIEEWNEYHIFYSLGDFTHYSQLTE